MILNLAMGSKKWLILFIYLAFSYLLFISLPMSAQSNKFPVIAEQDGIIGTQFDVWMPIKFRIDQPSEFDQYDILFIYGPDYSNRNIKLEELKDVTNKNGIEPILLDIDFSELQQIDDRFSSWITDDKNVAEWDRSWYVIEIRQKISQKIIHKTDYQKISLMKLSSSSFYGHYTNDSKKIEPGNNLELLSPENGDESHNGDTISQASRLVEILSPHNGSRYLVNKPIDFEYIPSHFSSISKCTLEIAEEEIVLSSEAPIINSVNTFKYAFSNPGKYIGTIKCLDNSTNKGSSEEFYILVDNPRSINVVPLNDFVPDAEYYSINDSIASVLPGGTVVVRPGYYREHIYIDKPVTLIGLENPTISGLEEHYETVLIESDNVTIQGFEILGLRNGIVSTRKGSLVYNNISIINNTINVSGMYGIFLQGRHDLKMRDITIEDNKIDGFSHAGILLDYCANGSISNNKIRYYVQTTGGWGIYRVACDNIPVENKNNICCSIREKNCLPEVVHVP